MRPIFQTASTALKGTTIALLSVLAASAQDVPYARPPFPREGQPDISRFTSLGDIMGIIELRHIKLWYAGRSQNWPLTQYTINLLSETLVRAALLYTNIPVEYVNAANASLVRMTDAVRAKNAQAFTRSYAELTDACNSCHVAAGVGFIRMKTPILSPFSDEDFEK